MLDRGEPACSKISNVKKKKKQTNQEQNSLGEIELAGRKEHSEEIPECLGRVRENSYRDAAVEWLFNHLMCVDVTVPGV